VIGSDVLSAVTALLSTTLAPEMDTTVVPSGMLPLVDVTLDPTEMKSATVDVGTTTVFELRVVTTVVETV